jgi:hypothetical protein
VLLGTAGSHAPKKGGHKGGNKGGHNGAGGLNARDREHPLDVLGKRRAPSDYFRSAHTGDEDTQATRRLKLEEREVRWHAARRSALAFVREDIHPHTKSEVDKAADLLDKHGVDSEDVNAKGKKNKDKVENATARVIEALRSLSSQYVSLKVMDGTTIVPTVARLKSHPHGTIASMATALCVQWLGSVHNAVGTLAASYERPPPPTARGCRRDQPGTFIFIPVLAISMTDVVFFSSPGFQETKARVRRRVRRGSKKRTATSTDEG